MRPVAGPRNYAHGRTPTAGTLPGQPDAVAVPLHHVRLGNQPHLLQRQQRVEGLPVLCPQLGNRRACVCRNASGRVRAAGAVPRPYHGPLAQPLFLRKRGHGAPVIRPAGTTGCKKCPRSGGRTDPAAAAAEARAAGFEPLEPYPGKTTDRWRCRCRCSTAIPLTLTSIRGGRTAYGTCSRDTAR